ncbi:PRC-barrel domain-containing protein, partial [Deinococcus pimensis]|uniref:PRC-barrel domain-containing protein n=1 Tax=Deinococcus pimensis TaxID=309888 RepID=UPI0005EB030F
MRKGRDIIGKPIVALDGGARLATVQDLVFDHRAGQLLALLVDEGGWFRAARVVPFDAVRAFGDDAVVIGSSADVVAANTLERVPDILNDKATLVGTTVMTTDGKNLGRLADMYFDETLGGVVGYDVTGGLFADLSSGRSFVPAEGGLDLGEDVAFVPIETAAAMQEAEPGGLRG